MFRAIPDADPARYVRGQYDGYLAVPGVKPDSQTETFAALRLEIDNWRWSGVPFFIRAGKALKERVTEVRVVFKQPPKHLSFAPQLHAAHQRAGAADRPRTGHRPRRAGEEAWRADRRAPSICR